MSPRAACREPIAIVGSACRFAGNANSPSKLWELLQKPQDIRREIPNSRFNTKGFYHKNNAHHGHANVRHSYVLDEDPAVFDAEFFGINPIETKAMDPQQRMLMETVYEAIESAGMTIEGLRGSDTGVYAGVMCGDYEALLLRDLDNAPTYFAVGTSRAVLSNRISYFFDWHGASVTMDTACSSSLVAVHMATQALRSGDSRMAVACGSNLILGPEMYIIESKVKMLSPDGLGRMWDKDANGYARGDGVAAIMLKTLSSALADGDNIECLVRETGLNQDGATMGLTMPSATAQQALIRSTYAKAGLDLNLTKDRPQYFEAHGTGTPAGDPVEAEAISSAFFNQGTESNSADSLYVGSIKTVLGHTEGTAGVAAILKAALAVQNSCIPPNLLFNNLNPDIEKYYGNLEICKSARPWPPVAKNQPRRASVNSFGFGGTNAHAIVESYQKPPEIPIAASIPTFTPFLFSALSEQSLRASLSAYASYLDAHPEADIYDFAYTLRDRRSVFPYRAFFPATALEQLKANILDRLEKADTSIGVRAPGRNDDRPKVLGVFTGQGAQYARMGADLIEKSPFAQQIMERLEANLKELPNGDRPDWSLQAELLAESSISRVNEAAISQPLCTALQIMLVDVLRSANVHFDAIVGHSSGEIAAAYAAGYLSARDAICVAYYRGLYSRVATSPNGKSNGAMIAAGTSLEDAKQLCEDEDFAGRVNVAASNSSSSVTISGDEDAIEQLEIVLTDEGKFNRRLKVDKAYHSRHMIPCLEPYMEALRRAGVKALIPSSSRCVWVSSVYNGKLVDLSYQLSDSYWGENLIRPVLFSQALTSAASSSITFDAIIEVGAHPALSGPVNQTIQEVLSKSIPYHGTLSRSSNAVEGLSSCLGYLWSNLGKKAVDLGKCEVALSGEKQCFNVLKGLPSYQWNHDIRHWCESRRSLRMRLRHQPFHPLLGDISPDSGPHAMRWKNVLKPSEIPWVEGHQVQGQIVFPAAGYVSTAIEGARFLVPEGRSIRLIELSSFHIHQAVMFDANDTGIEVSIELSQVSSPNADCFVAKFTYSAALGDQTADFMLAADGELVVSLGEASSSVLPEQAPPPSHLIPVDQSRLYGFMESLEYDFTGPFRSLIDIRRKLGMAFCIARKAITDDSGSLLIHPVDLDAAFQSVMLAYSYPGDDQLRLLHLPTSINKIRINPAICTGQGFQSDHSMLESSCNREDRATPGSGFSGSANIYLNGCTNTAVQIDQVKFKPVGTAASDDRQVFSKMYFVPNEPDGELAAEGIPVTQYDKDLLWLLSRIASFFLRQFDEGVPEDSTARIENPFCHYLRYARHMTKLLKRGGNKWGKPEWADDTLEDVMEEIRAKGVEKNSDVGIMLLVGKTMPRVFRGETNMLEHFRESGLLDEYYAHGFGTMQSSMWLSKMVKQITDFNSHLNFLEIGAGTGGATKNVLRAISQAFDSYTFTDISSSFFENAAESLAPWKDRLIFKACDAERNPVEQGFVEGSYDVIIAFLVLHATAKLDETMKNLRKLLKPGGYLIVGEGSSDGPLQAGDGFIFGTLPGWWRGVDEGRNLTPFINIPQWDAILRRTGFSGIDTMSPRILLDTFGVILFVSQAVDARVQLIREPLSASVSLATESIAIVGGETLPVAHLAQSLQDIFEKRATQVNMYTTLEEMDDRVLEARVPVIGLTELDCPIFKEIVAERWYSFRKLFETERTMLWLTTGRLGDDPFSNMTPGFGRSARHEADGLRLQFLDVPRPDMVVSERVAEIFIRLCASELDDENLLYTREQELIIDTKGRHLVPRLSQLQDANDRYNSIHRPITQKIDPRRSITELFHGESSYGIRELSRYEAAKNTIGSDTIELRTTHAVLSAIKTPMGYQFLALGLDSTGARYLTTVSSLTSVLKVSSSAMVSCKISGLSEQSVLTLLAAQVVALTIVDPCFTGQTVVIHNASRVVADAIAMQASAKGVEVLFLIDAEKTAEMPDSWIKLPLYLRHSDLSQIIPAHIACFASFSDEKSENESTILSGLSPYCRKETVSTMFSKKGIHIQPAAYPMLKDILQRGLKSVEGQSHADASEPITLENLSTGQPSENPLAIIDWTPSASISAKVTRFDIKTLFKPDKTYWLCGLSGALGISLCDWMINRGVRYLVLTSRNPKVEPTWIEEHQRSGTTIKIMSCDVTDEKALGNVYQTIVDSLPPITGVLNGAMVLRDVSVRNMTYDQVLDVIRPKVLGSLHLDRIFHDTNLDFFVLLSSINCVIGNVGQANYAAANMGMCGVAANRRKRGLASCVVNVGAIIGVGYITESARQLDVTVARLAMMHLSEEDFHQIFAEAMEAGHLDSLNGPEISTGVLTVTPNSTNIPKWYSDPKFGRFIVNQGTGDEDKKEQPGLASIQEVLLACRSEQDVSLAIKHAFGAQLRRTLQTSTSDDDLMSMRGADLGLDSLIAVDIRSWLLKNFQVNIPVLKIMAGDTQMSKLVELTAEGMPVELAPQVKGVGKIMPAGEDETNANITTSTPSSPSHDTSSKNSTTSSEASSVDGDMSGRIDWEAEVRPPLASEIISFPVSTAPSAKPKTILLTGVSGLLGHHLLATLAAEMSISKIICIAVRNLEQRLASAQLPAPSSRIVYHAGDLSLPRFGLSEPEQIAIFSEIDAVIHNGSDTSHLKFYPSLRASNVGSTRQLVHLCLARMIPLHYVSSAGVALFAGLDAFPEISCTTTGKKPPMDGAHGYMCGKWVCESLLERVHAEYGLPVTFQRPSTIIREGEDAVGQKAERDWVNSLVHYAHQIKAVPKVEHNKGSFDLVRVQTVCADIVGELFRPHNEKGQSRGITYINNVGDAVIPMNQMADILPSLRSDQHGSPSAVKKYNVLSMKDWIQKAIAAGLHPAVAALIETFDEPEAGKYPRLMRGKRV